MKKTFKNWLSNEIRSLFCGHDFEVLYLDSKSHMERDFMAHSWVCRCNKCGKISRIDSKMAEL